MLTKGMIHLPKSLKSQGFSDEEILAMKREKNRIKRAKARANGVEKTYTVTLTKENTDKLQEILESHSLSFPQFIREIACGKIKLSFPQ